MHERLPRRQTLEIRNAQQALEGVQSENAECHRVPARGLSASKLAYCIWSSILEKAAFSFKAFLISPALTNGYSPYSRKLGH